MVSYVVLMRQGHMDKMQKKVVLARYFIFYPGSGEACLSGFPGRIEWSVRILLYLDVLPLFDLVDGEANPYGISALVKMYCPEGCVYIL